ncbi:MAG: hypothetical protein M3Y05_07225 [Gemmatimonadota bacterium]|nr:hypothetical protein [Gemmatimonadota bacterium]
MRRKLVGPTALLALTAASGCVQSAEKRAERASARASEAAPVRASPTVQRVMIPPDSGRLLYDAPTDLSDTTTRAAKAPSSP